MRLKLFFGIIIFIILVFIFPIGLNYILQISVAEKVIGTPVVWLSFWGSYITAIISGVMVYFSYKAIRVSVETTKVQRKLQIHNNLREAIFKLRNATDLGRLYELQQDLQDKKYTSAKNELYRIQRSYNEASNNLDYILVDRDILYGIDERIRLTKEINSELKPIVEYIRVLSQFAIMQDGWAHRSYGDKKYSDVLELQDEPLSLIIKDNPHSIKLKDDYSETLLIAIANKYRNWDYTTFENKLLSLYKYDSKKAKN